MSNTSSLGSLTRPLGMTYGKKEHKDSIPIYKRNKKLKNKNKSKSVRPKKKEKSKQGQKNKKKEKSSVSQKQIKVNLKSKKTKRTFTTKFESTKKAFEFVKNKKKLGGKKAYW
jgi:hypothetical protein